MTNRDQCTRILRLHSHTGAVRGGPRVSREAHRPRAARRDPKKKRRLRPVADPSLLPYCTTLSLDATPGIFIELASRLLGVGSLSDVHVGLVGALQFTDECLSRQDSPLGRSWRPTGTSHSQLDQEWSR